MKKIYICSKCKKELKYHPTKYMQMEYNDKRNVFKHDITFVLCDRCRDIFERWLNKN